MSENIYTFEEQLAYGKEGEKLIFEHLMAKKNAITIKDLSEDKNFQSLWIDGMYVYENEEAWIIHSFFFDVKTDYQMHKRDTIFIETSSDYSEAEKLRDWILSTKAEYFLYYDPVLGRLLWLPVHPFREWYYSKGISKVHIPVKGKGGFTTEGIVMNLQELMSIFPFLELEMELKKIDITKIVLTNR